ncbi:MAG: hypothetical protein QGH45_08455 [Myxococcota bacterium]|nr:hypothetical protein [Myxococcota bacterium]
MIRHTRLALLAALLACLPGCRPIPPRGLPQDPGEALSSIQALDRPTQLRVRGRFRVAISGIAVDFGVDLLADRRGNARVDLDYPFGGRAMTLVLSEDGALLGEAHGLDLVLFTPDAGSLMGRVAGPNADASQLVDLLLGRLPGGFDGRVTWERREQHTVLAMEMHGGRRALFDLEQAPVRLQRMVLEDGDKGVLATATWTDWRETEGIWMPSDVELDVPGSIGLVSLNVREIQTAPEVSAETYRVEPPTGDYKPFESLFESL